MFSDVFKEVLKHNGVVSVTSWSKGNVHVANTWNSYLQLHGEDEILIPAAWFNITEKNVMSNNQVIMTFGSPDVQGKMYMGTGFVVEGPASFLREGEVFDEMKEKFPFLTKVLVIKAEKIKQTI
ncbi:MAG: pyridoxamine 5'-phosphate oxidase family protein [Lachnospiraceae bacterium]